MADVFCNNCGHRNPAGANFCSSCGQTLGAVGAGGAAGASEEPLTLTFSAAGDGDPAEDQTLAVPELPEGMGMLWVKRGPNAGSKFALDAEVVTAGRHPDSDIFLDDITVSRRHAEFSRGADGYAVCDVGSLNGTYLNRERIEKSSLTNGDEVQIGRFKLVFLGPTSD